MTADRVILVRHGRTTWNATARFQGQTDIALDDVGVGQARRTADALYDELVGTQVRMVSSDLSRAAQTARALATKLHVEVDLDPRLREISAGEWEGRTRDEITQGWPEDFEAWRLGRDVRLGGNGETRSEAAERCASAIIEHEKAMDHGTLICVGHGGALRGAIFTLLGTPDWPWNALEGLRNAHWAELQNGNRGWRLSRYNVS
ncbi:histidine phosphatase family protein [Kineosporia sp. NBRC 101731]|uniref:histidine phosphatase family protein n=1 Tax=Kineosporia sp. NBRC 101731 TaxID=3032199 RepID=UPI0024A216B9|nr:histidine phosphatase family protein [Kineosporia sp. NBRC 101731]GLY31490.1 phosphoglycerate mutase [Kineosporia sp. NBRC 101731]